MSRALVTGGVGPLGAAVVRRLLRDPAFEVRVSDPRPAPGWMREGASIHSGDLREPGEADVALRGCSHVIHLGDDTLASFERAIAIMRVAAGIEQVTLVGDEGLAEAARAELPVTVCRPAGLYGPGFGGLVAELLRAAGAGEPLPADSDAPVALTYVDDVADALVLATALAAGETFAIAASAPLREVAELCWSACGNDPEELVLTSAVDPGVEVPAATALERATGWRAVVAPREGIARSLASLDHIPGGN